MKQLAILRKWPFLALTGGLMLASTGEAWASSWSCSYDHGNDRAVYHSRYGRGYSHWDRWHSHGYRRPIRYVKVVGPAYNDTVVINVTNGNGSYTPVTLRRAGGSYIGPRGEYYTTMPTEEQLRAVYGLK